MMSFALRHSQPPSRLRRHRMLLAQGFPQIVVTNAKQGATLIPPAQPPETGPQTGEVKTYTNSQGKSFRPIQDTQVFATCP